MKCDFAVLVTLKANFVLPVINMGKLMCIYFAIITGSVDTSGTSGNYRFRSVKRPV